MKPLTCTCGSHTWVTSPGPTSPSASLVLVSMASAERWECTTPFGRPVEPEATPLNLRYAPPEIAGPLGSINATRRPARPPATMRRASASPATARSP